MAWRRELATARAGWIPLTLYQKFEHGVVLILTALIMVVVVAALWNLAVKILVSMVLTRTWDPTDYSIFQAVFGMIFTVIIALEFKRSLLVIAERKEGIVQVRTVILIALLAIVRKLIILDLSSTEAVQLFALAAAILALGGVYWLIRDQDRRERVARAVHNAGTRDMRGKSSLSFDPISAAIGGALIGLAVTLLMLLNGRLAGISGVMGDLLEPGTLFKGWRVAFLAGLIAAPLLAKAAGYAYSAPRMPESWLIVVGAGLLVGVGTRMSNGCTSGHGICGIARISPRSIVATLVFMAVAIVVVAVTRHGMGG